MSPDRIGALLTVKQRVVALDIGSHAVSEAAATRRPTVVRRVVVYDCRRLCPVFRLVSGLLVRTTRTVTTSR